MSQSATQEVYQLKITLAGSKPPIWRRIQVESDTTLADLSEIILASMGWLGHHLHQFIINGSYYGVPHPDYGEEMEDEASVTLEQLVPNEKQKFVYEYDFGDSWEHVVLVEKILPRKPDTTYPHCITGRRACPPDDCGGIWGYAALLETLANPDAPDHEDMKEWMGDEDFDPAAFDVDEVNASLKHVDKHRWSI